MLNRFKRLLAEITRGTVNRNSFHAWEIEILLDMEDCALDPRRRNGILDQYERAVERQMKTGPGPPMKLSEFLVRRVATPRRNYARRMTRRPSMRYIPLKTMPIASG